MIKFNPSHPTEIVGIFPPEAGSRFSNPLIEALINKALCNEPFDGVYSTASEINQKHVIVLTIGEDLDKIKQVARAILFHYTGKIPLPQSECKGGEAFETHFGQLKISQNPQEDAKDLQENLLEVFYAVSEKVFL